MRADGLRCARYPLHDLERLLGWPIVAELVEWTGHRPTTVQAWKTRGLSWEQADELACRFGYHPFDVWGEDWWEPLVPPGHPRSKPPARVRPKGNGAVGSVGEQITRSHLRRELAGVT